MTHVDDDNARPQPGFVSQIQQAQQDAALLLNFLSGRKVRYLEELANDPPPPGPSKLQQLLDILATTAEDVYKDRTKWTHLLNMRDLLAQKASPATVESIRVTQSYVGRDNTAADGRHRRVARWLKLFYPLQTLIAFAAALVTMSLLYHADNGERILVALDGLRTEHAAARTQAAQAFQDREGPGPEKPVSCADDRRRTPFNRAQIAACAVIDDIDRRMNLTYLQLEAWNRTTEPFDPLNWLFMPAMDKVLQNEARKRVRDSARPGNGSATASAGDCPSLCIWQPCVVSVAPPPLCPGAPLPVAAPAAGATDPMTVEAMQEVTSTWNRTELRTRLMLDGLGNYGIPTLLGFVGAAVFVFRRHWTLLEEWSLDGRERFLIFFRPMLGAIIGGFVSLFVNSVIPGDDGFRIAPGILAFLCGYSVQFFFDLLDGFIERRLQPSPPTG